MLCIMVLQSKDDRSTVKKLFEQYAPMMIYTAQGILKDRALAEDAVSRAFVRLIENLQKFSFKSCNETRGLLVILVRNECFNLLREKRREKAVPPDELPSQGGGETDLPDIVVSEESCGMILKCLARLKPWQKDILRLKALYDYSDAEIAHILGISPGNVRVRLFRARRALSEEIRKEEKSGG
ncbi:MAG TPA: RNA polymerase subunit sigma-70 [Ruminococcaceae bacterium]|nr:RNA polymerase subunit sigma-70 [Oscillospiraceae bacterium]HBG54680.1 RNA polymerase subunit sigma-70 [Oscillospiraceae bacterium]HBQ46426.1 RNA polymerase subunit sigma-70 [Oscillospiraceae bacterium]HBT90495.1 RNA polymerase subunit sigma-70 [Oscillospiraceae bacterium]